MADNQGNSDPNQRLENAVYGAPKINPDEQRHYLGTFRERVTFSMTVAQLRSDDYLTAFATELDQQGEEKTTVFLNGNLGQDTLSPYIRVATMHAAAFTIKNDPTFKTDNQDLALVVAAKTAVDVDPIDVAKKYPATATTNESKTQPKQSFWKSLFGKH